MVVEGFILQSNKKDDQKESLRRMKTIKDISIDAETLCFGAVVVDLIDEFLLVLSCFICCNEFFIERLLIITAVVCIPCIRAITPGNRNFKH